MDDKWIDDFLKNGILPADVEDTIAEFITQADQVKQFGPHATFYEGFLRYMRLPLEKMTNDRIRYLKENMHDHFRFLGMMGQMGWDQEDK